MDFGSLVAVERAAERLISRGIASLSVGDLAMAERALKSATKLRRSSLAELLLGFTRELADPDEAKDAREEGFVILDARGPARCCPKGDK